MPLTREGKLVRTDIWREGKYLDLWSIPHFLSGMCVAFTLFFLGFETDAAVVIAFLLLVAYEMFEVIVKIEETRWNRILDVVVGMASFTPTFLLAPTFPRTFMIGLFVFVLVADGILSFFGWRASQKAAVLEERLRAEYLRERERLVARRARLRDVWRNRRAWRHYRKKRLPEALKKESPRSL